MYREAGYEAPHLVWWNAREAAGVPFTVHESGAHLVAGCSPSILKSVLNGELISATDVMHDAVSGERYQPVADALSGVSYGKLVVPAVSEADAFIADAEEDLVLDDPEWV